MLPAAETRASARAGPRAVAPARLRARRRPLPMWSCDTQGHNGFGRVCHKATRSGLVCPRARIIWPCVPPGQNRSGLVCHRARIVPALCAPGTESFWSCVPQGRNRSGLVCPRARIVLVPCATGTESLRPVCREATAPPRRGRVVPRANPLTLGWPGRPQRAGPPGGRGRRPGNRAGR